jgi:hypothetical protein
MVMLPFHDVLGLLYPEMTGRQAKGISVLDFGFVIAD